MDQLYENLYGSVHSGQLCSRPTPDSAAMNQRPMASQEMMAITHAVRSDTITSGQRRRSKRRGSPVAARSPKACQKGSLRLSAAEAHYPQANEAKNA